jgi:hypothetical protein
MDPSDIQRLIGEAARRHGVLLEPNDPLFVAVTLNEMALAGLIGRVEAALQAAQDQVSAGAVQQREAAKALAGQVIAGGVEALTRANARAAAEQMAAIRETLAEELAAFRRASAEAQEARRSAWLAALTVAGAVCLMIGAAAASWLQ